MEEKNSRYFTSNRKDSGYLYRDEQKIRVRDLLTHLIAKACKIRIELSEGLKCVYMPKSEYEFFRPEMPNKYNANYKARKIWFEKIYPNFKNEDLQII